MDKTFSLLPRPVPRPAAAARTGPDSPTIGIPATLEVLTQRGKVRAGRLMPGMRVITREAGAATLRRMVRRPAPACARHVRVCRDALGGKPDHDLVLPAGQRVLVRDWRARALWGAANARVEVARLIDGTLITWTEEAAGDLVELSFDGIATVYAAGLELVTGAPAEARIR